MTNYPETTVAKAEKLKKVKTGLSLAGQVLAKAQAGREIIQPFCPLAQSLEWELGQEYLRQRGSQAFLGDASPIPFVVNNDGTLSRKAAEVFFESCQLSVVRGQLQEEETIYVLELGVGVGLFARYFLDHFKTLCRDAGVNYYNRLVYIAGDKSERMLMDLLRHGVLANHPGRYQIRPVDALQPEIVSGPLSVVSGKESPPLKFRAVFLNYLLDCLPAAVLEFESRGQGTGVRGQKNDSQGPDPSPLPPGASAFVKQLYVQTCLGRNVKLADYTDMTLGHLQEKAKSKDPKDRRDLLEVYGLFASEYDYRPIRNDECERMNEKSATGKEQRTTDDGQIPYLDFSLDYGRRNSQRFLHSYGAIQCLERLLPLVQDDGFILINDYGQTRIGRDKEFEHQRFSLATAVGLNFPELQAYFERPERSTDFPIRSRKGEDGLGNPCYGASSPLTTHHSLLTWLSPHHESGGIHSRLLGKGIGPEMRTRFQEVFGKRAQDEKEEPLQKAREGVRVGRFEQAAGFYNQALEKQPGNWVLLNEVSHFLIFQLRDLKAGIDLAKLALNLNPTCSGELWNTLGDGLFEFGRTAEAGSAYRKALKINGSDLRAHYNLAWCNQRQKKYQAALLMLAKALALDRTGEYRERLLQKQQEILAGLMQKNQQEYLLLINLVSKKNRTTDNTNNTDKKSDEL